MTISFQSHCQTQKAEGFSADSKTALVFLCGLAVFAFLGMALEPTHDAAHPHHMNAMEDLEDVSPQDAVPDCLNPVLFAGHDPSSKNHARPVYEAYKVTGSHCALWFDLATPANKAQRAVHPDNWGALLLDALGSAVKPVLLFTGNSVAPIEYGLIAAAKARGIKTVTLVEFGPGNLRSTKAAPPASWPDNFLVTNPGDFKLKMMESIPKTMDFKLKNGGFRA